MTEEHSASDRLKARLIGAVALLLIGVIAWFWLLGADNPIEPVAEASTIPPAPQIQPYTVPAPTAPAGVTPVESTPVDSTPVESTPVESMPVESAPGARAEVESARPVVAEVTPAPVPASTPAPAKPAVKPKPAPTAPAKPAPKPEAPAKPVAPASEKFEMDSNNLPVAWVVQVGAMGSQAAADKLKAQLIAKGFKAYTQQAKLANGNPTIKVYVGPKLSRERADAQKKALDAALKTSTMVVRFPAG